MILDIFTEEEAGLPRPRKIEEKKESKANSKRAELLERTIQFLNYKGSVKGFAVRMAWLKEEDLEYMLSSAKAWTKNPQACWWKIFNESKPK